MAGPLDASGRTGNYLQRTSRYFLDKAIYGQQVTEDLICVERAEWTIDEDTLREHLERLRRLQQTGREDIRITKDNSGIIIVERRLDMERCRVITTYTPEGMGLKAGEAEMFPYSRLDLIHVLRRSNGRWQYFE